MGTNKGKSAKPKSPSKPAAATGKIKKPPKPATMPELDLPEDLRERIARKAYELYQKRGRVEGHDLEDWLDAEAILRDEINDTRK